MLRFVPFSFSFFFLVPALPAVAQSVVINEIMFAPGTGEAEWVELFNAAADEISIRGWTLLDRSGATAVLSSEEFTLPAGGYAVIAAALPLAPAWESLPSPVLVPDGFPSLNNGGDDIILRNAEGRTVDSLSYTSSWSARRGVSAERLRHDLAPLRENWSACTDPAGGTPGMRNSVSVTPADPLPRFRLIINEIMPAPLSGSCEWVELYNPEPSALDLGRWSLAGKRDSNGDRDRVVFPTSAGEIPASGYAVIAADSSILSRFPALASHGDNLLIILDRSSLGFANTDDEVLLMDAAACCIDSVWYDADWHHPLLANTGGISLELMNPAFHALGANAWSSCAATAGGTPGLRNSIHTDAPPGVTAGETSIAVSPNPFSPDGDGHEDFCVLTCRLPASVNQVRIRIYDVAGRRIATLRNNHPMGREAFVVWDGMDDAGRRARVGPYVVLLEGIDTYENTVGAAKAAVVVARRL